MSAAEIASLGGLGAAVVALLLNAYSTLLSARAADVSSYLEITDRFPKAWRRFRDSTEENKQFEIVEVLNLIESACHLLRLRRFQKATSEMLELYLKEVVAGIATGDMTAVRKSITSDETYEEIRKFAERQGIKFF
ncbi:MAG: hypothetical protein WCD12_17875 [Candidatus Binatus sp.]|uniref:hypothetical protein n=1 Tax=Candidatus Binatus sp. TaxID=2811406 RepID=UPI003C71506C